MLKKICKVIVFLILCSVIGAVVYWHHYGLPKKIQAKIAKEDTQEIAPKVQKHISTGGYAGGMLKISIRKDTIRFANETDVPMVVFGENIEPFSGHTILKKHYKALNIAHNLRKVLLKFDKIEVIIIKPNQSTSFDQRIIEYIKTKELGTVKRYFTQKEILVTWK